jgi:hypothetical protein
MTRESDACFARVALPLKNSSRPQRERDIYHMVLCMLYHFAIERSPFHVSAIARDDF